MSKLITPPNFQETDSLLGDLFEEVKKKEAFLSGGQELPLGTAAVGQLLQTKVRFGNPKDSLVFLTEEVFGASGLDINTILRQQMREQYDFYYMTVTVDLVSKPGTQFRRLVCELNFGPKGNREPIVQTTFPNSKWREVINLGIGMELGLNGNLDWVAGVDSTPLGSMLDDLPSELKANIANKNGFKAFVSIPNYTYKLGRSEITTSGEGNSICNWCIDDQELQNCGTMKFAMVFKVPKGTESITLDGIAWAEPNMSWLTADIRDVFDELSAKFKDLFKRGDVAARQLARGVIGEKWMLILPKPTTTL